MELIMRNKLLELAKKHITTEDSSHDFNHAKRVLKNVELIAESENADLEILIPAAIFHDVIIYSKNNPRSKFASEESADFVRTILENIEEYPNNKIAGVEYAIKTCSYSKKLTHNTIEAKILQDADSLEATGAISIMRTFASSGQMGRPFYNSKDPFCEKRTPNPMEFGLDLFYSRLLIVKNRLYTKTAKNIAEQRTEFLKTFIKQLKIELM